MKLSELRPGIEGLDLDLELVNLSEPREVETYTGVKHRLLEGVVRDASGSISLTVWNERIADFDGVKPGDSLRLKGTFVTSYKGRLSVNVGRGSSVERG